MVRLHQAQTQQGRRFAALSRRLRDLALKATQRASAATMPLSQLVAAIALSTVIAIALSAGRGSGGGAVTVGGFVAFIGAMLMLVSPTRRLADVVHPVTRGLAALERGLELLDTVRPEADAPAAAAGVPNPAHGDITLRNVTVRYRQDAAPALDGVDCRCAPARRWPWSALGLGQDHAGQPAAALRGAHQRADRAGRHRHHPLAAGRAAAQFALVSQDVIMLNDSIAANVALGAEPIDRERVQRCLRQANLAEHVATLAQGMDTLVGHNATELSGGQRQRLAIARALYKDAPVLLLDEATSALDTHSERLVQQALNTVMAGRTTLVIAHRLSTIEHADRIVVMERGRVMEQGTHAELMGAAAATRGCTGSRCRPSQQPDKQAPRAGYFSPLLEHRPALRYDRPCATAQSQRTERHHPACRAP
jgi:subfamily B ATP-binding cassette protein MsbA